MVTVTSYDVRQTKDGRSFITLKLTGSLELVLSPNTGRHYATVRSCNIPSTFDTATAERLIGTQMPGDIVRVPCEPYEFAKTSTGEVVVLNYNYGYLAPGQELIGVSRVDSIEAV